MAVGGKNIYANIYIVSSVIFLMALGVVYRLVKIQYFDGEELRDKVRERNIISRDIPANRGNVYSADGSLLATSMPMYTIRFDSQAPKKEDFDSNVKALSDSLSVMLHKPASHYEVALRTARAEKNRYLLIVRGLNYMEYMRLKKFPLFKMGPNRGGIIAEQKTVRQHPIGKIAQRTIGYERDNGDNTVTRVGIEGAFSNYLKGTDGRQVLQRMSRSHYKPISDGNEVEPIDGKDVVSTIDVYIQDIAHHALLKQLEYYEADHGCVIVMEAKTGAIRAISNLGRADGGGYYETVNYAVGEKHEPGSTFKLAGLLALLESGKADTATTYDTQGGLVKFYRRSVRDSKRGGYGVVSLARGFEVSSNTVITQGISEAFKDNPSEFIGYLEKWGLDKPLGISLVGEAKPYIPKPGQKGWSGVALPWMAFGYGLALTPLQTLTLYNAVANNGEMVKPQFVSEVKEYNNTIIRFEKEVINPQIASPEVIKKVQAVLANVVKKGTGRKLYSPNFSMAGKTGTAQVNYGGGKGSDMYYSSSFAGYFPAENPEYSCIVVIHKPNRAKSYYGADVSGPVFKRIAQKIYTDVPSTEEVKNIDQISDKIESGYEQYYAKANAEVASMPDVCGMAVMDAIPLLENMGLVVKASGVGRVKKQSIIAGSVIQRDQTVILELS
ncbi:penicillin-binding protein [Myroides guanonis]|uniref:Cell division protein FtsI (Penicillin-binding protein 3) n=1 Tax=Myroides guanonis TaxID=1150112 RepID=A0A1I3MKT7_9FLAO|nr:penicillin-binding protein [Myroides guanonis]SFI97744.1 cell division protein FtsI (penicillin-binding protein 3) [Myroides guanonis]